MENKKSRLFYNLLLISFIAMFFGQYLMAATQNGPKKNEHGEKVMTQEVSAHQDVSLEQKKVSVSSWRPRNGRNPATKSPLFIHHKFKSFKDLNENVGKILKNP